MRNIATMEGDGVVTAKTGDSVRVHYDLHVFQRQIPAGTMENPHATLPRLMTIRGTVSPFCFFGQQLTLKMKDGRELMFFFVDSRGNIAVSSDPTWQP